MGDTEDGPLPTIRDGRQVSGGTLLVEHFPLPTPNQNPKTLVLEHCPYPRCRSPHRAAPMGQRVVHLYRAFLHTYLCFTPLSQVVYLLPQQPA
jgi:hypothetical protein